MCDELAMLADAAVMGDGLEQGTQLGPIQNKTQYDRVMGIIESARKDGKIIAGGERQGDKGYFIRPTIVRDITDGSRLVDEEQFGPVLPVIRYTDAEDALARANDSDLRPRRLDLVAGPGQGLRPGRRGWSPARCGSTSTPTWRPTSRSAAPRAPASASELGEEGLAEFTQLQVINVAR